MAITSFSGQYFFLSNFYRREFRFDGVIYPTSEHAFQCAKAARPDGFKYILDAPTPGMAKLRGRQVPLKPDWEEIKVDVMKNVLRAKFSPGLVVINSCAIRLHQTGEEELIEGNTWGDTFWGQCPLGNGENMLGKLLMKVRSEQRHHFNGR
jgi:ribA/ribD-fused uncharacterized protein